MSCSSTNLVFTVIEKLRASIDNVASGNSSHNTAADSIAQHNASADVGLRSADGDSYDVDDEWTMSMRMWTSALRPTAQQTARASTSTSLMARMAVTVMTATSTFQVNATSAMFSASTWTQGVECWMLSEWLYSTSFWSHYIEWQTHWRRSCPVWTV